MMITRILANYWFWRIRKRHPFFKDRGLTLRILYWDDGTCLRVVYNRTHGGFEYMFLISLFKVWKKLKPSVCYPPKAKKTLYHKFEKLQSNIKHFNRLDKALGKMIRADNGKV